MASARVRLCERPLDERRRAEDGRIDLDVLARPAASASSACFDARASLPACCPRAASRRSAAGPGPSLMTASPIGGGEPMSTSATSPSRNGRAAAEVDARCAPGRPARRSARGGGPPAAGWAYRRSRPPRATAASPAACDDRVERDAVGPQPIGIDQHLKLLVALAPDGDVGHAGHRHQLRPDRPQRQDRSARAATASSTRRRSSSRGWSTTAAAG